MGRLEASILYLKKETQKVELIDLDFGKPDQRFMSGVAPIYFIEDIFAEKNKKVNWDMLKTVTPIDNLKIISSSPSKASQGIFHEHRNKLLYYLNESDAQIKIIDFGGGLSSNLLYFLRNSSITGISILGLTIGNIRIISSLPFFS